MLALAARVFRAWVWNQFEPNQNWYLLLLC